MDGFNINGTKNSEKLQKKLINITKLDPTLYVITKFDVLVGKQQNYICVLIISFMRDEQDITDLALVPTSCVQVSSAICP